MPASYQTVNTQQGKPAVTGGTFKQFNVVLSSVSKPEETEAVARGRSNTWVLPETCRCCTAAEQSRDMADTRVALRRVCAAHLPCPTRDPAGWRRCAARRRAGLRKA